VDEDQKDMRDFMNDLEEDPEMRQNVQLFKDEDVIDSLEKQLAALTLEESSKSPLEEA